MEVTVISQENIRPSSQSPDHLKPYELCLLDQLGPSAHSPIIFYYSSNIDTVHLKKSLSDTLTHFYPLAGKIKDIFSLDGIDEGAFFAEARVNCSLRELLSCPDLISLHKLLPCELVPETDVGIRMTNIQVNRFECGGVAIALCVSHKIVDGGVLSTFVKGWSDMARGDDNFRAPDLSAASVFPAAGFWPGASIRRWPLLAVGKCSTKRFMFSSSSIETLKDQVRSNLDIKYPSRVEVISTFMWKRVTAASQKLNDKQPKASVLFFAVNLRRRMKPPMPENSLGNFASTAITHCEKDDMDKSLACLTGKVRKSVQKLQGHFVGPSRVNDMCGLMDEMIQLGSKIESQGETTEGLVVASWCKFGYHEIDFGWGKPVWVSLVGYDSEGLNVVILVDTMDGNGIEAWVTIGEKEMIVLEEDEEMGKYAVLNPSPLSFDDGRMSKVSKACGRYPEKRWRWT